MKFMDDYVCRKLKGVAPKSVYPLIDATVFLPYPKLEESLLDNVEFLKGHPLVPKDTTITGWVYKVETGKVRQVV
jgi:carbonic anhydrase